MGSQTIKDPIIVFHSEAIRYPVAHHLVTGDVGIQHPDYLERSPIDVVIFRVAIFRPESYKHHPVTTPPDVHIEVFFYEVVPPAVYPHFASCVKVVNLLEVDLRAVRSFAVPIL